MSMIRYRDYVARAEFDEDIGLFAGRVLNLSTPVTFYAPTAEGLPAELAVSIETYLDVCRERGITPETPTPIAVEQRLGTTGLASAADLFCIGEKDRAG